MSKATELRNQRAGLLAQAKEYYGKAAAEVGEGKELATEAREQWQRMMDDAEDIRVRAQRAEDEEKMSHIEAELRQSAGRKTTSILSTPSEVRVEDRKTALRAWTLQGTDRADYSSDVAVRAANAGLNLHSNSIELRALSVGTSASGGYTVPISLSQQIEKALKYYSNPRNFCKVITTATGDTLNWPTVTDVSNVASVISEGGSVTTNVDPTFGEKVFLAQKYHSDVVKVSVELLQDSIIDLEGLLADLLAERIARKQEADFINGAGGGTAPNGLVTGANVSVNLASGNAITFAKLKSLEHSVDIAYRQRASFLMHDSTWAAIEQIVDSSGRPIFLPGYQGLSDPSQKRLFGYPVNISNAFSNYSGNEGTNEPMILFGDMNRFMIRDVAQGFTLTRLNELYAANQQVGFQLWQRCWCDYIGPSGCVNALSSFN